MDYSVNKGIYNLDFQLSSTEKSILDYTCNLLENKGFKYLSIPSTITYETFKKQEVPFDTWYLNKEDGLVLAGSAEQGILQYFTNKRVEPMRIYSRNTCFRIEDAYSGLKNLNEFTKVEQYVFCEEKDWEREFKLLLSNGIEVLETFGIEYRLRDVTNEDQGYHIKKIDIEVLTNQYGWMETHSCTYFGTEQAKRYDITGANYTLSCTGIATPRVLVPIIEKLRGE